MNKIPNFKLIVIGVDKNVSFLDITTKANKRIFFEGIVTNIKEYFKISDIILESMPFPSLGATAEGVYHAALYPVLAYTPRESIISPNRDVLFYDVKVCKTEEDYISHVIHLVSIKPKLKLMAQKSQNIIENFVNNFASDIKTYVEDLNNLKHSVQKIPATNCEFSNDDIIIANKFFVGLNIYFNLRWIGYFRLSILIVKGLFLRKLNFKSTFIDIVRLLMIIFRKNFLSKFIKKYFRN